MMGGRPTIFRHLLNSDLPPSEVTDDRLSKEAQVLIGTGTVTTAGSLCFICYHIMVNPAIKKRLQEDLKPIMANYPPKKPTWAELETAPYLQAVIKEGLRYFYCFPCA
jgi:cytochrome P450